MLSARRDAIHSILHNNSIIRQSGTRGALQLHLGLLECGICRHQIKLGYSQGQAAEMVARAANDLGHAAPVDALIRESLRAVGR